MRQNGGVLSRGTSCEHLRAVAEVAPARILNLCGQMSGTGNVLRGGI
jgi:hypothetical protein